MSASPPRSRSAGPRASPGPARGSPVTARTKSRSRDGSPYAGEDLLAQTNDLHVAKPLDSFLENAKAKRMVRRHKVSELEVTKPSDHLLRRLEALEESNTKMEKAMRMSELQADRVLVLERKTREQEAIIKEQQRQISRLQKEREQTEQEIESVRTAVLALQRGSSRRSPNLLTVMPTVTTSTTDFRSLSAPQAVPQADRRALHHPPPVPENLDVHDLASIGDSTHDSDKVLAHEPPLAPMRDNFRHVPLAADKEEWEEPANLAWKLDRYASSSSFRSTRSARNKHLSRQMSGPRAYNPMKGIMAGGHRGQSAPNAAAAAAAHAQSRRFSGQEDDGPDSEEEDAAESVRAVLSAEGYRLFSGSDNAFGVFIFVAMTDGIWVAVRECGLMLIGSVLVQFVFSWQLFQALESVYDGALCGVPSDLQISAVFVFSTLMLNNVPPMLHAAVTVATCKEITEDDSSMDNFVRIKPKLWERIVIFVLGNLTEWATWWGLYAVGILFILTSNTVELVMRSTVSIIFVIQVDELSFQACCSPELKNRLGDNKYKVKYTYGRPFGMSDKDIEHYYGHYLHVLGLAALSMAVVYGIRQTPPNSCPTL